uniref:Conserved plasma membrane protein n=1 Tax=Haemonchus contortus TaxID=6289 RepID=A0A7I4YZU5_HAECO
AMMTNFVLQLPIALLLPLVSIETHSLRQDISIAELNTYLETFFAMQNTTTVEEWEKSLPTPEEREDMRKLLSYVYRLDVFENLNGEVLKNYPHLMEYLNITVLQGHYCVIHELIPKGPLLFPRMWGYTVIASKSFARRLVHHSAVHYDSDGPVCAQAAALFENTQSRTLAIAGASRYAVKGNHPSECQQKFQLADAAHNNRTMFHWVSTVLKDLADEEMKAVGKDNGHFFIQWHGMAQTSCMASDVFLSAGIHNGSIYETDIPVRRLAASFNRLAEQEMKASTPREDPDCRLTATTNVFGRYINGVLLENVCNTSAEEKNVIGRFAHVEQKAAGRAYISLWTSVIEDAFPVSQAGSQLSTAFLITIFSVVAFYT